MRNADVVIRDVELCSQGWHVLRRTTFDYRRSDGEWITQQRETYDRGDGATILLYDTERAVVLLTRQFRYPAYVNGHPDGRLIETAAGLLDDDDDPETAVRRESYEELGVVLGPIRHVFDVFMSPGSVTEKLHFYAAPYSRDQIGGDGGGVVAEGEDIEALEVPFDDVLGMVGDGRIADAKTIMLIQWAALNEVIPTPSVR